LNGPHTTKKTHIRVKKRHTVKYQVLVNAFNLEILDIYRDLGPVHDFRMFKESLASVLPEGIRGQRLPF